MAPLSPLLASSPDKLDGLSNTVIVDEYSQADSRRAAVHFFNGCTALRDHRNNASPDKHTASDSTNAFNI